MAVHRCSVYGCEAEIVGMDDMPPESVVKVFPWWAWTGRFMLCPGHRPQGADPVWQWRDTAGNAANVSAGGALHSHGDIHSIALALAVALANALVGTEPTP